MQPLDLPATYKLAAAIVMGMAFGFVLVKSDLAWPKSIMDALRLRNGRIIKTLLLALGAGAVLFFYARQAGMVEVHVRTSYLWGSIFGGIFCGAGLVLAAMTPVTIVVNFAAGRYYAFWALVGMILAYPALNTVSHWLLKTVFRLSEPVTSPLTPMDFFAPDNPALYVAAIMAFLLLLVHFTVGDPEE